jgi:hypothetical protein
MKGMSNPVSFRACRKQLVLFCVALMLLLPLAACKKPEPVNTQALDDAGMWFNSVAELRSMNVSNAEIGELAKARQAGLTDPSCVELIKLARSRQQPFSGGQSIAELLATGIPEQTVLELARLNQLGLWAGQAEAMHLAGLPDKVILAVAQRRSQNLPVLSGEKLGELRNAGATDTVILDMVEKGVTEEQASNYIVQRQNAAGGHGFVYQGHGHKKRG